MAKILKFELSEETNFARLEKLHEMGESEKCLTQIDSQNFHSNFFYDLQILKSSCFEKLGERKEAINCLFKLLDKGITESLAREVYYKIAINFLELNLPQVGAYYLDMINIDYELLSQGAVTGDMSGLGLEPEFRLVYPRTDDYYFDLIEESVELVSDNKFSQALELLQEIPPTSRFAKKASQMSLMCLMMKGDIDQVIYKAEEIIKNEDNLNAKCLLVSAYLIEEKMEEAEKIYRQLAGVDYENFDDIMSLLPLFVNFKDDQNVLRYTNKILAKLKVSPNILLLNAIANINTGDVLTGKRVLRRVATICPSFESICYFIERKIYESKKIEYATSLPVGIKIDCYEQLKEILCQSDSDLEKSLDTKHTKMLIEFAYFDRNAGVINMMLSRFVSLNTDRSLAIIKDALITKNLPYDLFLPHIMAMNTNGSLKLNVVASGKFKPVDFVMPFEVYYMPELLKKAIAWAYADIIYYENDYETLLTVLGDVIDSVAMLDNDSNLVYLKKEGKEIKNLKSIKTMTAVLFAKVDMIYGNGGLADAKTQAMDRFSVKEKTFDKYWNIFFGSASDIDKE